MWLAGEEEARALHLHFMGIPQSEEESGRDQNAMWEEEEGIDRMSAFTSFLPPSIP